MDCQPFFILKLNITTHSYNHILILYLLSKSIMHILKIINKYGFFYFCGLFLSLLLHIRVYPNSYIFWAFILNQIILSYFVYVKGCALGIKQTIEIFSSIKADEEIQKEISKNN